MGRRESYYAGELLEEGEDVTLPRKPSDPSALIYDASEAMYVLKVDSYKTLCVLVEDRGLPAKNIGTAKRAVYRFLRSDIEQWMKGDRVKAAEMLAGVR